MVSSIIKKTTNMNKKLEGNAHTAIKLMLILGFLGVLLGGIILFQPWNVINKEVVITGFSNEFGLYAIILLVIYAVLLYFRSIYSLVFVLLFFLYTLEAFFGLSLFKYMPLADTTIEPALYLGLPTTLFLLFMGAFGTIMDKFVKA